MKYDVFISYRREGGYDTAKHLNDLLIRDGYKVSFDIDTLRNGDFDTQLLERIDQCKDFILIVDQHAFDRTLDPNFNPKNDWLRCELSYALKKNKNIIPVFLAGANDFPKGLPSDIAGVTKKNGPEYNRYYFNDFYKTLKDRFLHSKTVPKHKTTVALLVFLAVVVSIVLLVKNNNTDSPSDLIIKSTEQQKEEDSIQKFCGNYSYVSPAAVTGGINYVYELVLDPVNSSCNIVEDGIVHITNSKGYCGTMMQWPDYWEVTTFNLNSNGKVAIAEMIGGNNSICTVSFALDEYNNIVMSYLKGNEAPSLLMDENGNYNRVVKFKRQ